MMELIDANPIVSAFVAAIVAAFGVKAYNAVDEKVEDFRGLSFDLAMFAKEEGFNFLVATFRNVAKGDKVGLFHSLKALAIGLQDPVARRAALDQAFKVQLQKRWDDLEQRPALIKQFEKLKAGEGNVVDSGRTEAEGKKAAA